MAFTYSLTTPVSDISRVRYHIGDVDADAPIFDDAEIAFAISEEGGWQGAVVSLIGAVLARLAGEPDMTADWLRIDWRRSAENWRALLSDKKKAFGLGARASASSVHAWRPDTQQRRAPTYDEADTWGWCDDA